MFSCKLKILSITRWTIRKVFIKYILEYYKEVHSSLDEIIHINYITYNLYDKFSSIMNKLESGNIYI